MGQVAVQERLLKDIQRTLKLVAEKQEDYITEKEAAKFLGVSILTLQNYVTIGKVPSNAYDINILGKRMYLKSKLISNG